MGWSARPRPVWVGTSTISLGSYQVEQRAEPEG